MRELFARLGKQTLVYGIGGAALQLVGLLTLPVYARVFKPAQYGVLEIATVGFGLLLTLVDSGMTSAAQRSFFDYTDEQRSEQRSALFTGLATMIGIAVLVAIAVLALADPISRALFGTTGRADLVRIVGILVPAATAAAYLREVMRLRFRAWHYVTSALIAACAGAVAGIVAVTVFDAGVDGVLLGLLAGSVLAMVYGAAVAGRDVRGRFSMPELRKMVHYGAPLIPAAFAMWGLAFLDRVMLSQLGGFAATGEYAVGSRYASVLMFGLTAFLTAFVPFAFSLYRDDVEAERQLRARLLPYVTLAFVTAGLTVSLFARELTTILAPQFHQAYRVVGILSVGVVFFAISNIVAAGIGFQRKTKYVGAYTVIAVAFNVCLNLLLIPPWGMFGAAAATTLAYVLLAGLNYRKGQQLYYVPYFADKTLTAMLAGCPLMAVGAIAIDPTGLAVAIKLSALILFAVIVWRRRVIDEGDMRALVQAFKGVYGRPPSVHRHQLGYQSMRSKEIQSPACAHQDLAQGDPRPP